MTPYIPCTLIAIGLILFAIKISQIIARKKPSGNSKATETSQSEDQAKEGEKKQKTQDTKTASVSGKGPRIFGRILKTLGISVIAVLVAYLALCIVILSTDQKPKAKVAYTTPKKESITEIPYLEVVVPAGKTINTPFYVRAGERVHFQQDQQRKYCIHGKRMNIPVTSKTFSCPFSNSDYVRLKGGPVTTIVSMWK